MATPPEEIERQHAAAQLLVDQGLPSSPSGNHGEIPLAFKQLPTAELLLDDGDEKKQHEESLSSDSFFPCWTSRGTVDVTKLQDLLREGYDGGARGTKDDQSIKRKAYKPSDVVSSTDLWDETNAAVNNVSICRPSHDAWGIRKVALVFADDFLSRIYQLPWWHDRDDLREAVQPILKLLGIEERQVVRLLFASLPPGVTIPVHHDSGAWVRETHRIHVPVLVKNPSKVLFRCGLTENSLQRIDCQPGHVFEINNQAKHAVSNCDDDHRVHLILDYVDADSARTEQPRIQLNAGEVLVQTRRSMDRLADAGSRPTPSFFILGAQKAGTTSLYEYMCEHPLVVKARRRETHCLDWRWNDKLDTLENQRAWCHRFYYTEELCRHPSCLTGDSTPSYLLDSRRVIPRLKSVFNWPVKFFVILRDPVRRALSHYAMVTSDEGTEAQLRARGAEWRNKSIQQVVNEELKHMKDVGLIPYFDIATGTVDEEAFRVFSGSRAENEAWDRFLEAVPLNTGSHCILARGMYELNLRPWLAAFDRDDFLILKLESMQEDVRTTMCQVWKHLDVPPIRVKDTAPKNQRQYDSIIGAELEALLRGFYEPHNRNIEKLMNYKSGNR